MPNRFNKYINSIDLESLFVGDIELVKVLEQVFNDGYKQGWKNAVEASPISDVWNNSEDDIWDDIYTKQLAEGRLTTYKQEENENI